ncbi:4-fold beta flower protein [Serratia fonticola]|uniref:4-fold beta flower protein n=1 Tax=Serratia fonticola TaxID=47917 RepID=UPI0010FE73A4|nr:hypothetical protein [Serratia fonticola]
MSINLFDSSGTPYAYFDDGVHLFTFSGEPIGYLEGDSIYLYNGRHVGYWANGVIRDSSGDVILFSEHATTGPSRPLRKLLPLKGLKGLKPMKGLRQLKPLRPLNSMRWSNTRPCDVFER